MSNLSDKQKGTLLLLLSALTYSIMPVLIRFLGAHGIPPISQVFLRYIFAFITAFCYFVFVAKAKLVLPKKHVPLLLLAAIFGYGFTTIFYTIGVLNTLISTSLFITYLYTIIAPIMGFVFLKDKVNKFNTISLTVSFIALILLFQPTTVATWETGSLFSFLAALATATYLVARKKLDSYRPSYMLLISTFLGMLAAGILAVFVEPSFYFNNGIMHISPSTWFVTILFGIGNFAAWLMMTKGFDYFHSTSASIILLAELLFGVFFAFLFFHEIPTTATFIGGILIIFASILVILKGEI